MGKRIKNARQSLAVSPTSVKMSWVAPEYMPKLSQLQMIQVGGDKRKRVGAIKEEEGEGEDGKPAKKRSSTQAGSTSP